ncbi:MAG: homoserine dehydrogenase [Planctomycetaceae bacterium]
MNGDFETDLNVAIVGCGTVGSGVIRILQANADQLAARAGRRLNLRRVVVRDKTRPRSVDIDPSLVTDDINSVIGDPAIDVVIQVMGGINPALQYMTQILQSGKDVITANKALLHAHGEELFSLAEENGCCISFEAAVAGGIPVIAAVTQCLTANQIRSIEAILNGTSNFILSRMLDCRLTYEDVLAEAQALGYAEADPAMDVDGIDAAQKLAILTQLAFGTRVALDQIIVQGIRQVELLDLQVALELGYKVKLLAISRMVQDRLQVSVQPTLVRAERAVAQTGGADNIIALEGDALGTLRLSGAGAGQMPTASAVVADLVDYATGRAPLTFASILRTRHQTPVPIHPPDEFSRRYYLRFVVADRPHVLADITDVLGLCGISISSVRQDETPDETEGNQGVARLVIITHRTTEGKLRTANARLATLSCIQGTGISMPISD